MAGYTRQSVADIIANAVIKAAPVNAEFNAIRDAFNNSTGHKHDGSSAEGTYVPLIADIDAELFFSNVFDILGFIHNYEVVIGQQLSTFFFYDKVAKNKSMVSYYNISTFQSPPGSLIKAVRKVGAFSTSTISVLAFDPIALWSFIGHVYTTSVLDLEMYGREMPMTGQKPLCHFWEPLYSTFDICPVSVS